MIDGLIEQTVKYNQSNANSAASTYTDSYVMKDYPELLCSDYTNKSIDSKKLAMKSVHSIEDH